MLDEEGFAYPLVDTDACIDCHLCEKACPIINPGEPVVPLVSEAITFNDEKKRIASSSGGAFTAIAEEVIARGGVVFGAKWTEDWHVVHDYTETIEGLAAFRGSKYVQCDTSDSYTKVRDFLKSERWVLYSGTPCQIRGLKLFLRKDYDKLITVDFICHGVPSIKVLHAYVKDEIQNYVRKDVGRNLVLQSPSPRLLPMEKIQFCRHLYSQNLLIWLDSVRTSIFDHHVTNVLHATSLLAATLRWQIIGESMSMIPRLMMIKDSALLQ